MKTADEMIDMMRVEDVVEMLYWITGGFVVGTRSGTRPAVVRWFLWHIEDCTPVTPAGVKASIPQFHEVIQKIPRPETWDQEGWYGRISESLDREGNPWGVGAVTNAGEIMRMTIGIPGVWRTMTQDESSALLSDCRWTPAHEVGELCHGVLY